MTKTYPVMIFHEFPAFLKIKIDFFPLEDIVQYISRFYF